MQPAAVHQTAETFTLALGQSTVTLAHTPATGTLLWAYRFAQNILANLDKGQQAKTAQKTAQTTASV